MKRITLVVPSALMAQANQLALCLGQSPFDGQSFGAPLYQDAQARLYSVASGLVSENFVQSALEPLKMPAWPVDLEVAKRAQAVIVIKDPEHPTPLMDTEISAIFHEDSAEVLSLLGLIRI